MSEQRSDGNGIPGEADRLSTEEAVPAPAPQRTVGRYLKNTFFGVILPVIVLAAGAFAVYYYMNTQPRAERKGSRVRNARLVEVVSAKPGRKGTTIHAMGTAVPARKVELKPRVSGEVISLSPEFEPGGLLAAGQTILGLDPEDFELVVRQRLAEVAQAESDLSIERGNQSIAQREYELLGESIGEGDSISEEERDLVLRKPQLDTVEASLDVARAALDRARLDLDRTRVKAPFNAQVLTRSVNLGAQVSATTALAELVGTDACWIELSLPVDQLAWITVPRTSDETGSTVRIYNEAAWGPDVFRTGQVIRLAGALEEEGRMARLVVSVPDPLALDAEHAGAPRILLGSYVRVEVEGHALDRVFVVERRHLRDGDRVWIFDEDECLEIRPVTVAFRGRDAVLVSEGLERDDLVITSDLSAAVEGMPLRIGDTVRSGPEARSGSNGADAVPSVAPLADPASPKAGVDTSSRSEGSRQGTGKGRTE